jgi:hypothetical protein
MLQYDSIKKHKKMAKQRGFGGIIGTFDEYTFYEAFGQLLIKRKGGLDPKKVKKNKERYRRKIQCSKNFGKAVKIVKTLYSELPKEKKAHGVFGRLSGMANQMIYNGLSDNDVVESMRKEMGLQQCAKFNINTSL